MEATAKRVQYEQQAQGLQGPSLIELLFRATEDPGMVHFGGLLALPSVQQVMLVIVSQAALTMAAARGPWRHR